jgi:transcriptional regulator with XRE-family HTH domain
MESITIEWIIEKMKANNLTQRGLAKKLDMTEFHISKWLNGHVEIGKLAKNHLYYFFRCLELEKELKTLKTT